MKPIDKWIQYQTEIEVNERAFDPDFFWRAMQTVFSNDSLLTEAFDALVSEDKEKFFAVVQSAFISFVHKEAYSMAANKASLLSDQSIAFQLRERFKDGI